VTAFRHHTVRRAAALAGVAALALGACTDDSEPPFEGSLAVGVILPQTGELAFIGPAQTAGVELALEDINDAGGVWGSHVTVEFQDEGDANDESVAIASADALIAENVNAVIGPSATERTLSVIEPLSEAGVIQVSPASPGIALDDHPARGHFFRVMPSDVIQGAALGQEIAADGHERVAIVARDDAYGDGLATLTAQRFETAAEEAAAQAEATPTPTPTPDTSESPDPGDEEAPAGEVVADIRYNPDEPDFDAVVAELGEAEPDAIVIASFDEGTELMRALRQADLAPAGGDDPGIQWYLVNGNLADYSGELPDGAVEGVKATAPAPAAEADELYNRMDEHTPDLTDHEYGAEAYDALVLIALGAVVANTDDPEEIRSAMIEISRQPGTACGTFAGCLELIRDGEEIDYQGPSGAVEWNDAGDPQQGSVGIYRYDADNTYSRLRVDPARL
jgi:ABC-type branched-subunit amino acid transport system substrate-binding protein